MPFLITSHFVCILVWFSLGVKAPIERCVYAYVQACYKSKEQVTRINLNFEGDFNRV